MSKAYPSNLSRAQFELLNDLIPAAKPGGRPRSVELWDVLNAIFYLFGSGSVPRGLENAREANTSSNGSKNKAKQCPACTQFGQMAGLTEIPLCRG